MFTKKSLLPTSLLAGLVFIITGCFPPAPPPPAPGAATIFNPADGFQFLTEDSASFNLDGLNNYASYIAGAGNVICYRVDAAGSEVPATIAGGLCDIGSTEYTGGAVALSCDDPNGGLEDHTVSIVFGYNNGNTPASIENRSVSYTIDCTVPDYAFDIGVELVITGFAFGGGTGTGYGIFDPISGELTYSYETEAETNFTWATTNTNEVLSGMFEDSLLSSVTGQTQVYSCTNHKGEGEIDQCGQINSGNIPTPFEPMNITSGDSIYIPEVGGDFQIERVLVTFPGGALETIATTTYTFTRTSVSHAIGGTVTGLDSGPGGTLQLQLNGDTTLDLTADGNYDFPRQSDETDYDVQIIGEPDGVSYACTFDNPNNSGVLAAEDVTDINITCTCSSTIEGNWNWEAVLDAEGLDCPVPLGGTPSATSFDANGDSPPGAYTASSTQSGCAITVTTVTDATQSVAFEMIGTMANDGQTIEGTIVNHLSDPATNGCFRYTRL